MDECPHRWTPWRRIIQHHDSLGNPIPQSFSVATLTGETPVTPGWQRGCPVCHASEYSHGSLTQEGEE